MVQKKINTYLLYHHSFHSNATKTLSNFLVRSAFKSNNQPGIFKCKRTRCKCAPLLRTQSISQDPIDPLKSLHLTCISVNVTYCLTCTLCKKIYIGETGRRLADRFRKHLQDEENFNLHNHSHHNMTICGLSLHHGKTESRKYREEKFTF